MRMNLRKTARFRRNIAWLAVAALLWSSGQGLALSAFAGGAWQCVMMPGGGMPQDRMLQDHGASGSDHGFCPVCSLTGCSAAAAVFTGDTEKFTAQKIGTGVIARATDMRRGAIRHQRPLPRAPPAFV